MQQVLLEQTSAEWVTPEPTTRMANEIMHDAFGTSSEEEEGHGQERVRRKGVRSIQSTTCSVLF
jgi:hypothetical protein